MDDISFAAARRFVVVEGWRGLRADDASAICAFWMRENALWGEVAIAERLTQVVVHARTPGGDVAGVATAVAIAPRWFGQPMYHFRTFVGRAWRTTPLERELTLRSCAVLEAFARERDFPCVGMLLEIERDRFETSARRPVWSQPRLVYVGRSESELELRAYYFDGAQLKSPDEVARLVLPTC